MKAEASRGWLSALLLLGLVAQGAVAATHSTLSPHPGTTHGEPADGEEHGRHDPESCSFCRLAHAVEHGVVASPLSLPISPWAAPRCAAEEPTRPDHAHWARPASRAPPCGPSA